MSYPKPWASLLWIPTLDIPLLINIFTQEEGLEETESKSEERPCLWADDYGKKIIVQLLRAQQWGIVGMSHVGIKIGWKESNTLIYINLKLISTTY